MANFLESKNPVLKDSKFDNTALGTLTYEPMTISGAINKSFILFSILLGVASISYVMPNPLFTIGGAIAGLITVLVASFKPTTSPVTAPLYAVFEGLFVGGISAMYAGAFDGIVPMAMCLTFGTLLTMLVIYKLEIVKVTEKFRAGVMMATGAIFLAYLMAWVFSWFGYNIPYIHEGGVLGIGFSVVVIGIASLNLLLDFDMFEKGEQRQAPAYMEWFAALGLLVTLVWLYIEFLRLLSKLNRD